MAYFSYICAYVCYNLDILPSYYHETIPIIKQHLRLDSLCDCSRNVYPYGSNRRRASGIAENSFRRHTNSKWDTRRETPSSCSPDASSPILLPIPRMSLT